VCHHQREQTVNTRYKFRKLPPHWANSQSDHSQHGESEAHPPKVSPEEKSLLPVQLVGVTAASSPDLRAASPQEVCHKKKPCSLGTT
jgi:hypothetical protein